MRERERDQERDIITIIDTIDIVLLLLLILLGLMWLDIRFIVVVRFIRECVICVCIHTYIHTYIRPEYVVLRVFFIYDIYILYIIYVNHIIMHSQVLYVHVPCQMYKYAHARMQRAYKHTYNTCTCKHAQVTGVHKHAHAYTVQLLM